MRVVSECCDPAACNKCRVHIRHETHGSVCVSAIVSSAGANLQCGQCRLEVFVGDAGLLDELKILRWWEYIGRLRLLPTTLFRTLFGNLLGDVDGVYGPTIEHHLSFIAGFGALLDLIVRDDPTHGG